MGAQTKSESLPVSLIRRAREYGGWQFGSPIAVMLMLKELTDAQYQAAADYQRAYREYLSAIGHKSLRTAKMESEAVGEPPDPDSDHGRNMGRLEAIAVDRYNERYRIVAGCGVEAARVFEAVVCAEVTPTWLMKITVARVATALAATRMRKDRRMRQRARAAG